MSELPFLLSKMVILDSNESPIETNHQATNSFHDFGPSSSNPPPLPEPPVYQEVDTTSPALESSSLDAREHHSSQPASFSRLPLENLPYSYFPPAYLIAKGPFLDSGFPLLLPPSPLRPHFFTTHDVGQVDWIRFVTDIQERAILTTDEVVQATIPIAVREGPVGVIVTNTVKSAMTKKWEQPIVAIINQWNHYFFHPRRMEVVLARGQARISGYGKGTISLDDERERYAGKPILSSVASSSPAPTNQREMKEEARKRKKTMKAEALERKRREKDMKRDQSYRLFVLSYDGM